MNRLRELRTEKNLSLRELAEKLELSYSSVGKYERDEAQPSFDILFKLADFFDVSIDYLIGYTDIRTKELTIQNISKQTGLSENAVRELKHIYTASKSDSEVGKCYLSKINTINILLDSHNYALDELSNYLYFSATHFKNFYDNSSQSLQPISQLELWDDYNKTSYSDDWDMWSNALLLLVINELTTIRSSINSNRHINESKDTHKNS
jgi:transcriptional regulator with XRE-family HTH domain